MISKSKGIDLTKPIEISHPKVQDIIMRNHQITVRSIVTACISPCFTSNSYRT